MKKFIDELKRRNVIKSTVAYLVFAWLLLQVLTVLLPILNAPEWVLRVSTLILAIGLPIWIIISWIYDITPEGIEKTTSAAPTELVKQATNKRLNTFIITGLSIAVIVLALNLTYSSDTSDRDYSLAVIPFTNLKVDDDKEWLSLDFTQNVNTYLSKVKNLTVIDFYSSSKYQGTNKSNSVIGEELSVKYLLRGTLTQVGKSLNIKVELIDTDNNKVTWSENFNTVVDDQLVQLSQRTSQKVVTNLEIALSPENKNNLDKLLTTSQEANLYFNEGVRVAATRLPNNRLTIVPKCVGLFQKAIDLDPGYADAYAEMAFILRLIREEHEIFDGKDKWEAIDSIVNKALEIDANNAKAYLVLGALEEENWEEAKTYYDKALSIKPNDADTHHYIGLYYKNKPKPEIDKAIEHFRAAYRLNPFSFPINANLINNLLEVGNINEAEEIFKKSPFPSTENFNDWDDWSYFPKVKKEVFEKKDWRIALNRHHESIEMDSTDSDMYRELAMAYNEVMKDPEKYLKYAKKAYELGRRYSQNQDKGWTSSNGEQYFFALLRNKKFSDAERLLNDEYFRSLFDQGMFSWLKFELFYYQENYEEAEKNLINTSWYTELLKLYSQQGKEKKVDSILDLFEPKAYHKATVFAIQGKRDSMYYYLESDHIDFRTVNGSPTFDPYRKEKRFKDLLRKHYLPLTHWNK